MLVSQAMRVVMTAVMLWEGSEAATSSAVKLCGRHLSEIMSRVCHAYNSPSWDVPTVIEQPGAVTRRKRQLGIADECCVIGCTWEQLSEYCSISAYSESPLEDLQEHIIADRSAEVASGSGATSQAAAKLQSPAINARAAPIVGTVSPLITWGRTLNTDLPAATAERDRYAYVVYT